MNQTNLNSKVYPFSPFFQYNKYFAAIKENGAISYIRGPYNLAVAKRFRTKMENNDYESPRTREYVIVTIDSLTEI